MLGIIGAFVLRPPTVELATARTGQAVDVIYASGVVDYVRQAHVAPIVTAPIRRVDVAEGDWVAAGQSLAQLEDGPQQGTALQLAAQASQARIAAGRTRRLFEAGFAAKAADDETQAQARAATAAADSAAARLRDYRLTAPFAGQVLRREAEPGDLGTVGTALFVIADPSTLRITADVDERDIARLKPGIEALIRSDAFPGRVFEGRVSRITPAGDAKGRVFRVRITLPADSGLPPGMTVETNLVTDRRAKAVLVPSSAVRDGVLWAVRDGRARRVPVRVGAVGGDLTEIRSGVAAGTRVIEKPPADLRDGQRVRVAKTR
ncbi:efflux RND transporter periplasmic adaptor subunit [Caulobacter segnis]|uniref:efflux RND transporter periplasmic adaptor subunit n=1 Tax=Caulobacter segnis TaxID=88688 RepID=UPI0028628955|nr:efflux RND transporter periplasmic adaptor subunit [Caulobacter segnis]MDR6625513.1 RND family efflux transporter MFP subunit [Caulobacter segnis]